KREQFSYWDTLLIENGQLVTKKREEFVAFVNTSQKSIMPFQMKYDPSRMSSERLAQYKDAEIAAAMTLVGPQRDDFSIAIPVGKEEKDVRYFGSRGQQRLVVLQLKLLQILYM